MTERTFDRAAEDIGNILNMEHINLTVPDQGVGALFYVTGLGFTRDPFVDFGTFNMWINCGEQQFHLPKRDAQKFRGHIGVVVPDLEGFNLTIQAIHQLPIETAQVVAPLAYGLLYIVALLALASFVFERRDLR